MLFCIIVWLFIYVGSSSRIVKTQILEHRSHMKHREGFIDHKHSSDTLKSFVIQKVLTNQSVITEGSILSLQMRQYFQFGFQKIWNHKKMRGRVKSSQTEMLFTYVEITVLCLSHWVMMEKSPASLIPAQLLVWLLSPFFVHNWQEGGSAGWQVGRAFVTSLSPLWPSICVAVFSITQPYPKMAELTEPPAASNASNEAVSGDWEQCQLWEAPKGQDTF